VLEVRAASDAEHRLGSRPESDSAKAFRAVADAVWAKLAAPSARSPKIVIN